MCNKPAMHRVVNGWEPDYDTDCLEDPEEILKYCKKVCVTKRTPVTTSLGKGL